MKWIAAVLLIIGAINSYGQEWSLVDTPSFSENVKGDFEVNKVSIDGRYAVVSNPNDEIVYVYFYDGLHWIQQAELTTVGEKKNDRFGYTVAISGDVIVVGTYKNQPIDAKMLAYVFVKPTEGWKDMTPTAQLSASDAGEYGGLFGRVAMYKNTIIADGSGNGLSKVYLYERPPEGWTSMTETAKLAPSDPTQSFGRSLSISDNVVVVGAPESYTQGGRTGSAYVFVKPQEGWQDSFEAAILKASNGKELDYFGRSVDVDARTRTVIVGKDPYNYYNTNTKGGVYVFEEPIEGWKDMHQTAILLASDEVEDNSLGSTVGIEDSIIVTSDYILDTEHGLARGAVYVYKKPEGGWTDALESERIVTEGTQENSYLGISVDISRKTIVTCTSPFSYDGGYYNGDGKSFTHSTYFFRQNAPPQVKIDISNLTTRADSLFNFSIPDSAFVDQDHDRLTYDVTLSDEEPLPAWLNFDSQTGAFSGIPSNLDVDTLSVRVTASDPQQAQVSTIFYLVIESSSKEKEPGSDQSGEEEPEEVVEKKPDEPKIEPEEEVITSIYSEKEYPTVIYPNPNAGKLIINSESSVDVSITDAQGKVVLAKQKVLPSEELDTSGLVPGIYSVTLYTEEQNKVRRLIILK